MRFLLLIPLLLLPASPAWGQERDRSLQASPAQDLFDLAQLAYREALDSGDQGLKTANFETALRQFTRFLQHHDDHAHALKAWYYSAICYEKLGQAEASLRCLRTVVARWKTGPLVGAAALRVANDSYRREQFGEAAAQFLLAASQSDHPPTRHLARYRRALSFQKQGKTKETIAALEKVLADEVTTYHHHARKALAHYYRNGDRKAEAYTLFQELANADDEETRADAILQSAQLARDLGKSEETLHHFEQILATPRLGKWHGEAQLFLMSEAAGKKDHSRVITLFEARRDPLKDQREAKRLLLAIQAYEQTGRGEATTVLYQQLERVAPGTQTGFEASYVVLSRLYPRNKPRQFARDAARFLKSYATSHADDRRLDNVRLMLAETHYASERFKEAARLYGEIKLPNLDPKNHPEVRFRLTSALRKAGDEAGSSAALTAFLKHHPDDPRAANALALRGDAARAREDYPAALGDYDQLLGLTRDAKLREYAWSQKAEIFKAQRDLPSLIKAHGVLLQDFPKRPPTAIAASWFWTGWARFRREEFNECLAPFDTARTLDANTFGKEATVHLALARYSLEQVAELQGEVDRLHHRHPKVALPRTLLAWLGVKVAATGNHEEAWRYLPGAVDWKTPAETKTAVWLAYARAALAIGHFKEAIPAYEILLAREKNPFLQADYRYHLAWSSFQLREHQRSRSEAEAALELKPQGALNGKIRFLLGELARVEGDPKTALQHYVVVVELYNEDRPTLDQALGAAIKILEENGDPDDLEQAQRYRKLRKSP